MSTSNWSQLIHDGMPASDAYLTPETQKQTDLSHFFPNRSTIDVSSSFAAIFMDWIRPTGITDSFESEHDNSDKASDDCDHHVVGHHDGQDQYRRCDQDHREDSQNLWMVDSKLDWLILHQFPDPYARVDKVEFETPVVAPAAEECLDPDYEWEIRAGIIAMDVFNYLRIDEEEWC
jgi:hypothetical protein